MKIIKTAILALLALAATAAAQPIELGQSVFYTKNPELKGACTIILKGN